MRLFPTVFVVLLCLGGSAQAAGLIEEAFGLPVTFKVNGSSRTLRLDALVIRPDDSQRHPLAVINHGAPRNADDRAGMSPRSMRAQAREFARRGWAVVTFMRRGYGESEGDYAESSGNCASPDYVKSGRTSAEDIRAVIQTMRNAPFVDDGKIISVGRSAGGLATVALTADPPPGLIAAISFAGGRGSTGPDEVCVPERLAQAFGTFGKTSRVPMLWVYSENDHFFGPSLARRFHAAFTEAGGRAEFIAAAPFGSDGHSLFSEKGTPIWTRYVDDFLARQKLVLVGQLLASRDPTSIHYPKGLSSQGQEAFRKYLDASDHKAFVMAGDGSFGWRSGQKTAAEAVEGATGYCRKNARKTCYAVMVDDEPVQ
ncbi:dienelactone hydrolase [Paramagnetospirillum kuznetsovii]|uniref:Dienelactone hydrolase n=1 Tax=Paramagnetospirillum kuznetsovii TaxID=2053833 RepID=A0A364P2Q9_9PROT|nr:CocE/NonD family hydrolase [Paramagnetospirillum kuznetsovii]RAU23437.1 dienelactone hydrolase [Paramagnetospirillum kuznetsovii]